MGWCSAVSNTTARQSPLPKHQSLRLIPPVHAKLQRPQAGVLLSDIFGVQTASAVAAAAAQCNNNASRHRRRCSAMAGHHPAFKALVQGLRMPPCGRLVQQHCTRV